jgi:hypothetical protein
MHSAILATCHRLAMTGPIVMKARAVPARNGHPLRLVQKINWLLH